MNHPGSNSELEGSQRRLPLTCTHPSIIRAMTLSEQIQKDMVEAMRGKQELRLSVLRMMKSAVKNKEIDKRAPLDDKEVVQVLSTMVKQRRDSIEQFTKGNRPELAAKEA